MDEQYTEDHYKQKHDYIDEEARYNSKPVITGASIAKYASTRISSLFDLPIYTSERRWYQILNPIPGLKEMDKQDWNFYFLGFFAWTVDAMDFFVVSASASQIAATLGVTITQISWGVTLVLMLRSVGAVIFGLLTDKFGRKYPYLVVCFLFVVVELGTGFVKTYSQFLGARAIFGILMGAMYPIASITALENQPQNAASVLSGLFLPGYNLGYIFAAVFFRAFEFSYKGTEGWRALFWFSAGLPVILIVWRLFWPESPAFVRMQEEKRLKAESDPEEKKWFNVSLWNTFKTEWLMFIYLVLLMTGLNFMSHGSQDLFPTLLTKQRKLGANPRTVITVVTNLGAICGGIFFGQLTEITGRRLSIIFCLIFSGAFIYPSFFLNNIGGTIGGYFFLCFGVMGAWGVAPIHLLELVNPTHRAFLSGVVYQLGNLASSASMTIEATLGSQFPLPEVGVDAYNYGLVMAIFCGCVFAYVMIIILIGPERFHRKLTLKNTGFLEESEEVSDIDEEKAYADHKE